LKTNAKGQVVSPDDLRKAIDSYKEYTELIKQQSSLEQERKIAKIEALKSEQQLSEEQAVAEINNQRQKIIASIVKKILKNSDE